MAPCIGHIIDWIIGYGSTITKYEVGRDKGVVQTVKSTTASLRLIASHSFGIG